MSFLRCVAFCLFVTLAVSHATAGESTDVFKDKTIRLIIPSGPGGTYAIYGNLIGRSLPKFIPGDPQVTLQFIPSDIEAMNIFYGTSRPDGLTIAILSQTAAITQVMDPGTVKYDLHKINALGTIAQFNAALAMSVKADVRTIDDLKRRKVIIGATDTSSYQYRIPKMMNRYLGTRFQIVTGYKDVSESTLAMERGEVDGVFTSWLAIKQQRASGARPPGSERVVLQIGGAKEPDLDAPLLQDLAVDQRSRRAFSFVSSFTTLSRGLVAPPGVPKERLAILRAAVAAMTADPQFATELRLKHLPLRPATWEAQQEVMDATVETPRSLAD